MAEQLVFGADIDNVTIKNINGKLTAVIDVENGEDEVETLSAYTSPTETDEHYVETAAQWLRHKPTQSVWVAKKEELKARSAPVNESITEAIELESTSYLTNDSNIRLELKHRNYTSGVDGASLSQNAINSGNVAVDIPKSQYANAKAFNEANAGKTFTITTAKRYAKSEGRPVVKPTEIQVAYPTLPYIEKIVNPTSSHDFYTVNIDLVLIDGTESAVVRQNIQLIEEEGKSKTFTAHYTLRKRDGRELTGTHTFTGWYSFDRRKVADYGNDNSVTYEKWEFEPFVLEGFYAKFTVNPQPYEETNIF